MMYNRLPFGSNSNPRGVFSKGTFSVSLAVAEVDDGEREFSRYLGAHVGHPSVGMDRDVVRFSHRNSADHFARSGVDERNGIRVVDADEDIFAIRSDGNAVRIFADLDILDSLSVAVSITLTVEAPSLAT